MAESGQIFSLVITILIDNRAGPKGTVGEKGFSALVELGYPDGMHRKILFDTGATGTSLLNNLKVLNKDLNDLDCIVFSHGHWDHVWGTPKLLPLKNAEAFLFCHPAALEKKWCLDENGEIEIKSLHEVISPEELDKLIPIKTSSSRWSSSPECSLPGRFPVETLMKPSLRGFPVSKWRGLPARKWTRFQKTSRFCFSWGKDRSLS